MTFDPSRTDDFRELFDQNKSKIRNFEGCQRLELYRDLEQRNIFFTYSYWEGESALEKYRHSDLFREVWSETKKLFSDGPQAWSVSREVSLE